MAQPVQARNERDGPAQAAGSHPSLTEAELCASNDWFILLRWIAGAGVILAALLTAIFPQLGLPTAAIGTIGAVILLYNLVFFLLTRQVKAANASPVTYRRLAFAQMLIDWLAIAFLIQFSGGLQSPMVFFFIFHIIIASTFFSRRTSFTFTILAILLFTAIAILEALGTLPHTPIKPLQDSTVYQDPLFIFIYLSFFISTLVIVTYLVTSISERLRRREAEVLQLSETLRLSSAKLQALNESAQAVNSTLELTQVLERLVANTVHVMGVRACSIRLLDKSGAQLESVAAYGLSQEYLNKGPIMVESSPLDREVLEGKIINIPDVPHSSLLQYPDWAAQEGYASMVSAPLIGKSGPLGTLRAYSAEVNHFTPDDEAFLSAIAAQGSIAIENALTYQTIESLDATKAAFIRVFTHELRSPVSVTRSLLQTIVSGYTGEINAQQRDILERAIRRVDFLRKLIEDLLDLATGRVPPRSDELGVPIALEGLVENVVQRFEMPAREKQVSLKWITDPKGGESRVRATQEGLDRIFNNLVSNAVRYTPAGGKVSVSLQRVGREVSVKVEDTGIGIPEDALPHLFEEFYRAPNAREVEREGTGLGLSIVRETVHNFGGRVAVQSAVGEGTCFTVTLPLVE